MPRPEKTFREKLADVKDMPRVVPLTGGMEERYGPGTILIPSPQEVDELMHKVPKGKLVTINQLREHLAERQSTRDTSPSGPSRTTSMRKGDPVLA